MNTFPYVNFITDVRPHASNPYSNSSTLSAFAVKRQYRPPEVTSEAGFPLRCQRLQNLDRDEGHRVLLFVKNLSGAVRGTLSPPRNRAAGGGEADGLNDEGTPERAVS